jgi:hypothetical protein
MLSGRGIAAALLRVRDHGAWRHGTHSTHHGTAADQGERGRLGVDTGRGAGLAGDDGGGSGAVTPYDGELKKKREESISAGP